MPVSPFARTTRRVATVAVTFGTVVAVAQVAWAAVKTDQVSEDPYTNTSSFHQTQVEPDTFSFGSTVVSTFQTGRFSNGGASNNCWATTTDNGATWTDGCLPGTTVFSTPPGSWARVSDPSVAYDPEHDVWMIVSLAINAQVTGKAVIVNRSTDGGLTWSNPVTVSTGGGSSFYDKEWITCDTWAASPHFGNCYIEWDDAGLGGDLLMSRSTDGGLTWTMSTTPNASVLGGQPVVQPNGTVVMPILGSGIDSFVSTNGGMSYTGPFNVASISEHNVAGNLRTFALPSAEVDAAGKVYVVWQDCRFRAGCPSNDVVMSTSTDGQTWSAVVRIPIDATTSTVDHFLPGIGVDRSTSGATARLGITYYFYPQTNCSVSTCRLKAGYVESNDAGATWTGAVVVLGGMRLGAIPLTTQGYMVGDYISTSFASNGKAYPVIPKALNGNCQVGQITSCRQFMVAPRNGLVPGTAVHAVTPDPVLFVGTQGPSGAAGQTAF